jgi:hypothetical protein
MAGVSFPTGARDFSLPHSVHTASEAQAVPSPKSTEGLFPGLKQPGRVADHSVQFYVKVKNGGALLPPSHTFSWHGT